MMDARTLYPEGHHPVRRNFTPDALYEVTPLSRADYSVRYYFIDFDLSVRFEEGEPHDVIGDVGRDNQVPELSDDVPYNAFKVDIFALGNLYYKEFCMVRLSSALYFLIDTVSVHRNIIIPSSFSP